ncbi:hypothetical protein [Microvirga massiliensis]|uniref:hypothetical protein n=1 Tax=Microvirga massiliensis TaxID=1033741 RepID=UPI00062B8D16|nr:hypothetical protein [Microvirga massiliensis]
MDRDALVAEAGLDWQASDAISLGVTYSGQIGERAQDHALKGNSPGGSEPPGLSRNTTDNR